MGKRYIDAGVVCPYYCSEGMGKICCEGYLEGQWVHTAWGSDKARREYKQKFCRREWEQCPIAKIDREK